MNGTTIAASTDVDRLIAEIDRAENDAEKWSALAPTDPFYVEPAAEQVVAISSLPSDVVQEILDDLAEDRAYWREPEWFTATYTMSGEAAPHIHDLRLDDRIGVDKALAVRETPNAAVLLREERVILVSRGLYAPVSSDGIAITFVSPTELERRQREEESARREEFLAVAGAVRPSWATGEPDFDDGEVVSFGWRGTAVEIGEAHAALYRPDKYSRAAGLKPGTLIANIWLSRSSDAVEVETPAQARDAAAALLRIADDLEAAQDASA